MLGRMGVADETFTLSLPGYKGGPLPSTEVPGRRPGRKPTLHSWEIIGLKFTPAEAVEVLAGLIQEGSTPSGLRLGDSLRYWQRAAELVLEALAQQKLLPGLRRLDGELYARWRPLLDGHRTERLIGAMPPVCRAAPQQVLAPGELLESFLEETTDALVREWGSVPGPLQDPSEPGSRWLEALFGEPAPIPASKAQLESLESSHNLWLRNLKLAGDEHFRVAFRLSAPGGAEDSWSLEFALQARDDPSLLVPAGDIWRGNVSVRRLRNPQERLLTGLGYAARFFMPLQRALESAAPERLALDAAEAFQFMRECASLLEEGGFGVLVPPWWNRSGARLGLRARVSPAKSSSASEGVAQSVVSLDRLVSYRWELSLGGQTLSQEEFEALAALKSPLVRLRGEWVRLDPEQVEAALQFFSRQDRESETALPEALRLGLGGVEQLEGLEVEEVDFEDGLKEWFDRLSGERKLEPLPPSDGLRAELRPYQRVGYSWLDFVRRAGLGACLADDMGLGKTLQTLALLSRDRESGLLQAPTLIVCPTSVVSNWQREAERFTPDLRVLAHQGPDRLRGEEFLAEVEHRDLVLSSYALMRRDADMLQSVGWHGVVLDEAQNIKNPEAKQSKVAYQLPAGFRLALTGTPVENRLNELWSIMRFLNPGYLGSRQEFRRRFARPIEREGDEEALRRLHRLTRPLVLRRLKSDPRVIDDLPDKQETKVYCHLSEEQASLYEAVVRDVMEELEDTEGIQRKGLVLSMLTRLKQICNHPAQFLHEGDAGAANGEARRSGKLARLFELLEETLSVGDRCLIFTQYQEMGAMLHRTLPERFDTATQFIHGGTPARKRTEMVRRFQEDEKGPEIFILSLKAGGTGLNLTRASHVFHFDRWWNPAVEDQATDRAYRIGQRRNVQVHKFVCTGTLEERIDEMIEHKKALAESIIGTDGAWITELSDRELREMVVLRREALV
jgi:SNF2 family DNA or RNA helicase